MFRVSRVWPSAALGLSLCAALPAQASDVELLSRIPPRLASESGGGGSVSAGLSADGRFVVFESEAENLVAGVTDRNPGTDVFLFDRATGETVVVSRSAGVEPATADQESRDPSISVNGRFVTFWSSATDLVTGQVDDGENRTDVFLWDRVTGTAELVSHAVGSRNRVANGASAQPVISADGRFVAFTSFATDLVRGVTDDNAAGDVFLYDRRTGAVSLVSRAGNLVSGQSGAGQNAFLWERASGKTTLVSHTASSPTRGAGGLAAIGGISADGSSVLYHSTALNVVPGQRERPRATHDVFLWSRSSGASRLVSGREGSASVAGNRPSEAQDLSADGDWAVFSSSATNLIRGLEHTHPGATDVYLWSRRTGTTTLLSHAAGSAETTAAGPSGSARISADGRWIAYLSLATDLEAGTRDTNGSADVILQSRSGDPEIVTLHARGLASATPSGPSAPTSIDASGRFVAFNSPAADLVAGVADAEGTVDVFVLDRTAGTITLVSRATDAAEAAGGFAPRLSGDGRFVLFTSDSTRLVPGQTDLPGSLDLFLHDRQTGTMRLVSHAIEGAAFAAGGVFAGQADLDASGRFVAFASTALNFIFRQGDSNGAADVFLYDRESGAVSLISRDPNTASITANGGSFNPRISADGRFLVFASNAADLAFDPGGPATQNLYVYDRSTETTSLVSHSVFPPFGRSAGTSESPLLAASGSAVAFVSDAPDLVTRDFNDLQDAFAADLSDRTP